MSRKNNGLSWVKKQEPKFIREFKERIAYKEQSSIETKKKKLDSDLVVEKEEDRPQVVQLQAGDLGEKEYKELKDKEDIQNAASSFGKILFKKPKKNIPEEEKTEESSTKKPSEIDLIFNLSEKGEEPAEAVEEKSPTAEEAQKQKVYLQDEQKEIPAGLQPGKKRFIDGPTSKTTNLSAAKVLARESKAGNKKLLSFYDEEQEEVEEFAKEDFLDKQERDLKRKLEEDSD
ncbi:hypothetical protein BpHYR1_000369 [Brachionus plicatilis]|uniref:DUF4604 domain-containing protein n=1 Tax=Brachionus plicatilis TaxID=10195 RepID=A0A3M7Q666_BRAPC|nr:hypothetical protein BpHYR1_000369 [Brachionus plicatilis]